MEKCKTLGEETYFEFSYQNNELWIKYGFTNDNQTEVKIDNSLIVDIIKRVNYLKTNDTENLRMVGYYSRSYWNECRQTQYCPYVAKLILDVFPLETINKIISSNKEK